jgi:hypothetical protein
MHKTAPGRPKFLLKARQTFWLPRETITQPFSNCSADERDVPMKQQARSDKTTLYVELKDDASGELQCVLIVEEIARNLRQVRAEPGAEKVIHEVAAFLACSGRLRVEDLVESTVGTAVAMFMQHVSADQRAAANYLRSFAQKMEDQLQALH